MNEKKKLPTGQGGQLVNLDYLRGGVHVAKRFWRTGKRKRKKKENHRQRKALIRAKR